MVATCAAASLAWADARPSQMDRVFARQTVQVAPRIHLIHKPAVTDPPSEGNVTVIEQRAGLG